MYRGEVVEHGHVSDVLARPEHEHARGSCSRREMKTPETRSARGGRGAGRRSARAGGALTMGTSNRHEVERFDPVTFSVVRGGFRSAALDMYSAFRRTAMLPILYEFNDFGMSVYNEQLQVLADAPGLPIFLGSLDIAIENTLAVLGGPAALQPGDVLLNNHPYMTGAQPADAALIEPIFAADELVGYAALRAHMGDLGGKGPYPLDATEIFQEGITFPGVKLYEAGELNTAIASIIRSNSRLPNETLGSFLAASAALRAATHKIQALGARYGNDVLRTAGQRVLADSEQATRDAIAAIPDGTYECHDAMDDDGLGNGPVELSCAVRVEGTDVTVDLRGSAPTQHGAINCPWPFTVTTCRFALKRVTTPTLPATAGDHRPLTVLADEGTIFRPAAPAPTFVGAGTSLRLSDMIVRAFSLAAPDRVPAENAGDLVVAFGYVVDAAARTSIFFDAGAIGHGAIAGDDGLSAAIHPTEAGAENLPVEMLEARMPVRKTSFGLIEDSGGPGEFRGGLAAEACFEFEGPGRLTIWAEKTTASTPLGLQGGSSPPARNISILFAGTDRERRLGKAADVAVDRGDVLVVRPAGGAGYGDPRNRDPAAVARDVQAGYVSRAAAAELYGVALDAGSFEIDHGATAALRARDDAGDAGRRPVGGRE